MVQRKVMSKVGIQDDHVKPENADLKKKKKMKKSGSFKKPDFEHLQLAKKPGKPPPLVLPTTSSKPIKIMVEATPNYMKSTTSSNSKKERGQVSSHTPQSSPDRKRSKNNNSDSCNKPTRKLDRTSSLKLVRTLTKAPRTSKNRVTKETCSSIMKDHKFPSYLTLSPGATQVEGTSVMKVCTYTYCSLNGHHHHEPVLPLKSFLSARRRMVKSQRGLKLGCLSPRRAKPRDILKEFEAAQGNGNQTPPFEESGGFFVEIYSKESEETSQNNQDYSIQAKTKPDFLNLMYESEGESTPSVQSEEADLETSEMDWESRMYSASYPHDGVANPILINHVIDLERANSALDDALLEEVLFKSEETVGDNYEKNMPDEIMQESMDDATESDDDKDRSDTLVDASATIDTAPIEDVTSNMETEVGDGIDNINNTQDDEFENMNENLKNSIGTQTDGECEDPCDMSAKLDEILKRSIGTQTDFEDDESDALVQDFSFATQCILDSDELKSSENKIDEATETTESITLEDQTHSVTGNADDKIYDTPVDGSHDDASSTRIKTELEGINLDEELTFCGIKKGTKRSIAENQESSEFNPREPNYLPVEPTPEAEKVDLRHLMLDDDKNADGWMLDHALQQAVTKLAPARKRKVALLVEAFETVLPVPKYETRMSHTATAFSHARPMQACS